LSLRRDFRALLGAAAVTLGLATAALAQPRTAPDGRPLATATFAAGCFWCAEADFEQVPGVVDAVSGYTGGRAPTPPTRRWRPAAPGTSRRCGCTTTRRA
jgi:hypothetical protein